jgi:hypothetical protein
VYSAFQKIQNGMAIKYFYQSSEIELVDACVLPDGEEQVTLKRRYAGTMILKQGVKANHIWVNWSPNSDKLSECDSEQSVINCDMDHWNEFFYVADGATGLRTPPDIMVTPPKRKFTQE